MKKLKQFLREDLFATPHRVVSLPPPPGSGEVEIEKDLLGWWVVAGKERVKCESEEEARYLRIFTELGFEEAPYPEPAERLPEVLAGLEAAFDFAMKGIEAGTATLLDPDEERWVRRRVWEIAREKLDQKFTT